MFKKYNNKEREVFNIILFLCFLVTFFLGLECFSGYKTNKELNSTSKIIYENLVLKNDDQKITLKEFSAVTEEELKEIKKIETNKEKSIGNRIVNGYINYSNTGVTAENKKDLERELNKKYKVFMNNVSKEKLNAEGTILGTLEFIYLIGFTFSLGYEAYLISKFGDSIPRIGSIINLLWPSFVALLYIRENGTGVFSMILFFLFIMLTVLMLTSKIATSDSLKNIRTSKQKYKMIKSFEENL